MPKTVDYLTMNSLFAVATTAEMCLVCLRAMEYDFVGMCWNSMGAIAVNAMDSCEWAAFAVCSVASVVHSKCAALIHCLLPLEPV